MKTIVTPSEVLSLAFGTTHTLEEGAVPPHAILSAEESYLLPALGEELYKALKADGGDEVLQNLALEYLKQPLALYVASRLLPTLALRFGSAGVVRLAGESFEVVDDATLHRAVVRMRADADRLLARATSHLASHPELYPLYNPQARSHRIVGGVVI